MRDSRPDGGGYDYADQYHENINADDEQVYDHGNNVGNKYKVAPRLLHHCTPLPKMLCHVPARPAECLQCQWGVQCF